MASSSWAGYYSLPGSLRRTTIAIDFSVFKVMFLLTFFSYGKKVRRLSMREPTVLI